MNSLLPPNSPSSPTTCPCPTCRTWRLARAAKAAPALATTRVAAKPASARPNGWAAKERKAQPTATPLAETLVA